MITIRCFLLLTFTLLPLSILSFVKGTQRFLPISKPMALCRNLVIEDLSRHPLYSCSILTVKCWFKMWFCHWLLVQLDMWHPCFVCTTVKVCPGNLAAAMRSNLAFVLCIPVDLAAFQLLSHNSSTAKNICIWCIQFMLWMSMWTGQGE